MAFGPLDAVHFRPAGLIGGLIAGAVGSACIGAFAMMRKVPAPQALMMCAATMLYAPFIGSAVVHVTNRAADTAPPTRYRLRIDKVAGDKEDGTFVHCTSIGPTRRSFYLNAADVTPGRTPDVGDEADLDVYNGALGVEYFGVRSCPTRTPRCSAPRHSPASCVVVPKAFRTDQPLAASHGTTWRNPGMRGPT
jgi:hypothetical protein